MSIRAILLPVAIVAAIFSSRALDAELTRLEIASREPYENGRPFGDVGPYERLRGIASFEVNPAAEANRAIVDLDLAPQNERGRVEFSADFEILVPIDRSKARGALLYDVNNRGNRLCVGMFNGGGADGFLMRQGFVLVWSGWIAEVLPGNERLLLRAPVATDAGKPIRGRVRAEFVSDSDAERKSIAHFGNQGSFRPTERGLKEATLSWRLRERDPRVAIPRTQWKLHQREVEVDGRRGALPLIEIEIAGGIRSGFIYELVYEAEGPIVQGLGLAGIRDLVTFLKHDASARNPLARDGKSVAPRAHGFGVSQSGRCLRMFVYDGFNADERGRQVFDGVIPHVAGGGLGFFNHRFASPTRHNAQHDNHQYPADVFPFTYGEETDPFTKRRDGVLRRAIANGTAPRIMHVQSSSEYWNRAGSLVHTDPLGKRDATIPSNVRIYAIGGSQHGPGSGVAREGGNGQLWRNPTDYRPALRALLVALDRWTLDGSKPPPSVYPTIASGTLVDWREDASGWNALPGVRYPEIVHEPDFVDRGPDFLDKRRVTILPPKVLGRYPVRVPRVGSDDNELGCLLLPTIAVPVATFTSWMLRSRAVGAETELLSLAGGYVPFARKRAERLASGDPRPSIEELYADFDDYVARFRARTRELVRDGYVLEEDVPRLERLAEGARVMFVSP